MDNAAPGDRVLVFHLNCEGTVRYVGPVDGLQGVWVGIELDEAKGRSNGKMGVVQYFSCPPDHSVFLRPDGCQVLAPALRNPMLIDPASEAPASHNESSSSNPPAIHLNDYMVKLEQRDEAMFLHQQPIADKLADQLTGQFNRSPTWEQPVPASPEEIMVEGDVTPVAFDWPPTPKSVDSLIAHFHTNFNTLVPKIYVNKLFREAAELLLMEDNICPDITVACDSHTRMIIVGDLHGHLNDLLWLLHLHGPPGLDSNQYFFNGDFVDRGDYGMEVLILILTMKLVWPKSVFLNRGNHESLSTNIMYGFAKECQTKYSLHTFRQCQAVFEALPLAHILNGSIFVVHGGLTRHDDLTIEYIRRLPRCTQISGSPRITADEVIFDLLWSDPMLGIGHNTGARGPESWQFGPDVTARFLATNNLHRIVRSHQVPTSGAGFEMLHDNRLITVFSASNYCGVTGNRGGVLVVTADLNLQATEYFSPPLADVQRVIEVGLLPPPAAIDEEQILEITLARIREMIVHKKPDLAKRFQQCSGNGSFLITPVQWVQTMAFCLELDIDWMHLLPHLVVIPPDEMIDWRRFLDRYQIEVSAMLRNWMESVHKSLRDKILRDDLSLKELINMFDLNHNGYVDDEELRSVLARFDFKPTPAQLSELTQGLVHNPQGEVLVTSFIESLRRRPHSADLDLDEAGLQALDKLRKLLRRSGVQLISVFTGIDTDGNGKVESEEFVTAMHQLVERSGMADEISDGDLANVVSAIDTNNSGTLCYMEFVDAFATTQDQPQRLINHVLQTLMKFRITLERAFFLLDANGDGHITMEEFATGLTLLNDLVDGAFQLSEEDIKSLVLHLDTNEDGTVDYSEFCNAFSVIDVRAICGSPSILSPRTLSSYSPASTRSTRNRSLSPFQLVADH